MVRYHVRSRDLVTIYNEIITGRLIPDAYFQRNMVWRLAHQEDFIRTILLGLPFPQIFISKGRINVETLQATSCIVDGQQRLRTIEAFIKNEFSVDGRFYNDLDGDEKSNFLKYEIAVIELDIENTDPRIREIFQRINRTSNALTGIEKLASEYAYSDFMFVCRVLIDDVDLYPNEDEDFRVDPKITQQMLDWARGVDIAAFKEMMLKGGVFTQHEVTRKVPLQYVLNMAATLQSDYYNRNDKVSEYLKDYAEDFSGKNEMVSLLNRVATFYLGLGFDVGSIWKRKANFFTLIVEMSRLMDEIEAKGAKRIAAALLDFENSMPDEFREAGQEAVNNKKQRELRGEMVRAVLLNA